MYPRQAQQARDVIDISSSRQLSKGRRNKPPATYPVPSRNASGLKAHSASRLDDCMYQDEIIDSTQRIVSSSTAKRVKFSMDTEVIYVASRYEMWMDRKVLWFDKTDFNMFREEAKYELQMCMEHYKTMQCPEDALALLYQPRREGTIFDRAYEDLWDLHHNFYHPDTLDV